MTGNNHELIFDNENKTVFIDENEYPYDEVTIGQALYPDDHTHYIDKVLAISLF